MYTPYGIRSVGAYATKTIPWDESRVCKVEGVRVTRYTLVLRPEHFPLYLGSNGLGGVTRRDIGRQLVVDHCSDGRWIDHLVTLTPEQDRQRDLEQAARDHDVALTELQALVEHHPLMEPNPASTARRSLDLVNQARQLLNVIVSSAQLVVDSEG